jgi:transposase
MTILNKVQHFAGFVYREVRMLESAIEVRVAAHAGQRGRCSQCQRPAPGYDRQPERRWQFVPLWGIPVWFIYAPRRVQCPEHGVVVEHIPWSDGKRPVTLAMMGFLATWARRLSWRETAQAFHTSWEAVYRSVQWCVEWGLEHRILEGIEAIGVDESRVRGKARNKLNALINSKLETARAWELKEAFQHFWKYKSPTWAGGFLDAWCERAMRSRLEPMRKVARMLRNHEELLLNWFRAKGQLSSGSVEGLNNKCRVVTRRAYGFRTFNATEVALYHTLGRLPEPDSTHRFC